MKKHAPALLICCAGLAIEALLILRIWVQATAQPIDDGQAEALFSITDGLASWFSPISGREPLQATGVIDYAVLLAAEVYFVATLALLGITLAAIQGWTLLGHLRKKELPDFVREQMAARRPRQHWQPVRSSRVIGVRYYAPLHRHAPPEQAKSALGR